MRKKPPASQDLDEDQILWQRVTQRVTPLAGRNQPISPLLTVKQPAHPAKPASKKFKNAICLRFIHNSETIFAN